MKYLTYLIQEKVAKKEWHPFNFKNHEPSMKHLFFVDDIILFVRVDSKTIDSIQDTLTTYYAQSGMTKNLKK